MPEGDTIHTTARQLRDALAGRRVVRFDYRRNPRGVRLPPPGTLVTDVEARGKHLLVGFDNGLTLHTHMQLTGAWHVYRAGERWRRPGHQARVVIEVDDGVSAVCFGAPTVELVRDRGLERLGPDLCTADADLEAVMARLAVVDPSTEIGAVLLDQQVASGIGNVYKSEVCWAQRVNPFTPLGTVANAQRRALYECAQQFLLANVGRPRRVTFANGVAVYDRARRLCPRCRTTIRAQKQGDPPRTTYWCPTCQPATGP